MVICMVAVVVLHTRMVVVVVLHTRMVVVVVLQTRPVVVTHIMVPHPQEFPQELVLLVLYLWSLVRHRSGGYPHLLGLQEQVEGYLFVSGYGLLPVGHV
jgi:hypothetical protein